ncbi:MAG: hypothetical protein HY744_25670 [Deltaproteobacteria bacterium]|nr:hypothetical protein [Deltaproteobacteria bacterium]
MTTPCVVDTMVLRKANALLTRPPKGHRELTRRVGLLRRVRRGELEVLVSSALLGEYRRQVRRPLNLAAIRPPTSRFSPCFPLGRCTLARRLAGASRLVSGSVGLAWASRFFVHEVAAVAEQNLPEAQADAFVALLGSGSAAGKT